MGGRSLQEEKKGHYKAASVVSFFSYASLLFFRKLAKKNNKINIKENLPIKKFSMYINVYIYIQNKRTILNFLSALGRI